MSRTPRQARAARGGARWCSEIGDRIIIEFNDQIIVESNDRPRMSRGAQRRLLRGPAARPHPRNRRARRRHAGRHHPQRAMATSSAARASRRTGANMCWSMSTTSTTTARRLARSGSRPAADAARRSRVTEYILDAEPGRRSGRLLRVPRTAAGRARRAALFGRRGEALGPHSRQDAARRSRHAHLRVRLGLDPRERGRQRLKASPTRWRSCSKKNPAETFLIEGHTDAVGSDVANLALSDRRAEVGRRRADQRLRASRRRTWRRRAMASAT